jgi:hypothetical protein
MVLKNEKSAYNFRFSYRDKKIATKSKIATKKIWQRAATSTAADVPNNYIISYHHITSFNERIPY